MPGIAGLISRRPPEECRRDAEDMVRAMMHSRDLASGMHADDGSGVYAGWVAHPGSFASGGTFLSACGKIVLLISGECFPDPDDIRRLKAAGALRSETPGAWMIPLYEERGIDFVRSLNGLFSGLLIDGRQNRIHLFNDRYGIERIHIAETRDGIYFASEAKSILRVLPQTRALRMDALADRIVWGCIPADESLFQGVSLLPGGSLWTVDSGSVRRERYFIPTEWEALPKLNKAEYDAALEDVLDRIMPVYFDGPRRPGISLTGGLDTRMVMAFRPRDGEAYPTYTFAGPGKPTLDVTLAARVAAAARYPHHVLRLDDAFFNQFGTLADRTVYVTDGTCTVTGTHEIHLHRLARDLSPVRLTGNFGSEILRSMSTFKPQTPDPDVFSSDLCGAAADPNGGRFTQAGNPVTFAAFQEIPWNLFGTLAAGRSELTFRTPFLDNRLVALAYQAPPAARRSARSVLRMIQRRDAAMSAIPSDRGLAGDGTGTVNRLRHILAELSFRIEYRMNEGLHPRLAHLDTLIQAAGSVSGLNGLHKFLHYRRWFRTRLSGWLQERMESAGGSLGAFVKPDAARRLAREHIEGKANHLACIQTILTLEAVERLLVRGSADSTPADRPLLSPESTSCACIH